MAIVLVENLILIEGDAFLTLYHWNTKAAKHYFCKVCGIYTHHQRRSNPHEFGFNVACFEDINPYELGDIPIGDGNSQSLI